MIGEGSENKNRCQFAALAAAAPKLQHLDLRGNLLTRHDDRSTFGPPTDSNPFGALQPRKAAGAEVMIALTECLRALPHLESVRLGIADHDTDGSPAWSEEQVAAVHASLPTGCTLDADESTRYNHRSINQASLKSIITTMAMFL